jgi:branched-chain amino acid transport system permease protein
VTELFQHVVFGLATGGFLLLASLGFSLVRRVEGFLNIAHAQFISFGAYTAWLFNSRYGWNLLAAGALAVVATALLALIVSNLVYRPIHDYGETILLITSIGVAFAIQGVIEIAAPPGTSVLDVGNPEALHVGDVRINPFGLLAFVIAMVVVAGMHVLFTRTRIGRQIRAVSVDRLLAQSRGVSLLTTSRAVWLTAGATAGMAGVALGLVGTLTTDLAFQQVLLIFAVAIFAGFGSLLSLLAAALFTGLAMDLSIIWLPGSYRSAIPFLIIIVVLLVRPQGLARGAAA